MEEVRLFLSPYFNFLLSLVNVMKFAVLEPDGRAHEFVLTGDKLGQEALDKVKSTRNAYIFQTFCGLIVMGIDTLRLVVSFLGL